MNFAYIYSLVISLFAFNAYSMDMPVERFSNSTVPSLSNMCTAAIVKGYGATPKERQKNSAVLIKTLEKTYDADFVNDLQNQHVGYHGWTFQPSRKSKSLTYPRPHLKRANFLVPHPYEKDSYFVTSHKDICILNIITGEFRMFSKEAHKAYAQCLIVSEDKIISADDHIYEGCIKIWDIHTQQLLQTSPGKVVVITGMATIEDEVFFTDNYKLKVWDLKTNKLTTMIEMPEAGDKNSFSQCTAAHNKIYCGTQAGHLFVIDPRSQKPEVVPAHTSRISCLLGSKKNGCLLYSGSYDCTIKQWDVRNMQAPLMCMTAPKSSYVPFDKIYNIYESRYENRLFATDEQRLLIWDVAPSTPELLRRITMKNATIHRGTIAMNDPETELYLGLSRNYENRLSVLSPNYPFDKMCD